MTSNLRHIRRRTLNLVPLCAVIMLTLALLAGCSIGPLEIGETGTPVPPTNTVPPPTATPEPRSVQGKVTDLYTGSPIAGAEVTAGGVLTATATDGTFWFDDVPRNETFSVMAEGYALKEIESGTAREMEIKLRPNTLTGRVTDAADGKPISQVLVKLVLPAQAITGTTEITPATNIEPTLEVTSTVPTTDSLGFGKGLAAPLLQVTRTVTGTTRPALATRTPAATRTPLPPTATPTPKLVPPTGEGFVAVYTDESGNFFFKDVPEGATLTFKMPGYELTKEPVGETARKEIALKVFKAEAIYVTANFAASPDLFGELLEFIDSSRINAVVINVQNDNSEWVYDTQNPDVLAAENTDKFLPDYPELVQMLRSKGIYTIARISTFQQPTMADARPDWAVISSVTGKPWKGGELDQQRWLDASLPAVHDHLIDMTKEVLTLGFDEIQYDYVRFPSDTAPSEPGDPVFAGGPITDTGKTKFIEEFLTKAHGALEPTDAFMSIDIFGYTLWPDRNGRAMNGVIGQVFENMVDHTDYVCPMIYPSHFSPGEQGCPRPEACAYELVLKSGELAAARFEGKRAKYRPWLQDFDWGRTDYTSPGTTKVTDQIRAAEETNAWGWMMWDPFNAYEPREAFKK